MTGHNGAQYRFLILTIALITCPGIARPQAVTFAAGPSIPQGSLAARRGPGGQVSVALSPSDRPRGFAVRGEITQGWFPRSARYARTPQGQGEGTLAISGALGYLLYTAAPQRASLHVGLGAGAYRMNIPGRPNPYGLVSGIGLVAGLKFGRGRVRGLIEVQQQVIASDYGNGDFEGSLFVPVRFGLTVHRSARER